MVVFEGLKFNSYPKLIDTEEISEGLVLNQSQFYLSFSQVFAWSAVWMIPVLNAEQLFHEHVVALSGQNLHLNCVSLKHQTIIVLLMKSRSVFGRCLAQKF